MINHFITDPKKRSDAFNALKTNPAVARLMQWSMKWMKSSRPWNQRVVAVACLEGVHFSSAFLVIYWLKNRPKSPVKGLSKLNEPISRDEALHTRFAPALYKVRVEELKEVEALAPSVGQSIIKEAVAESEIFVRQALEVEVVGLDADDVISYVKCCADTLSNMFGFGIIYGVKNPYPWMMTIGLSNKSNFFETKESGYAKISTDATGDEFAINAEF
jgi:ribonucleotide reductase beta subunit family protein with ferritin-like domain